METKITKPVVGIWFGAMIALIVIIGIASYAAHTSAKKQMQSQPVMSTGALENTYNQVAGMMNTITVSIYDGSNGSADPKLLGSGIIISRQYVLTNAHIVNGKTGLSVSVFAPRQGSYPVALARTDPASDLAILKIASIETFFTEGKIGNSDAVDTGDIVFAMGNAFGNGNLLTYGMVIDKNFSYTVGGQRYPSMFRTNINNYPGTCGGPLVNIKGEIIGINNSEGHSGTYMGIGYATPINRASVLANFAAQASPQQLQGSPGPYQPAAFTPQGYGQGNPYSLA